MAVATLALGGCIRHAIIEPTPRLAISPQSARSTSARVAAIVAQTMHERGFTKVRDLSEHSGAQTLAIYEDYEKIVKGNPDLPQPRSIVTTVNVDIGVYKEWKFGFAVVRGDPRTIASVWVQGSNDFGVLFLSRRIARDLNAGIKELRFDLKTTSKYSGEF